MWYTTPSSGPGLIVSNDPFSWKILDYNNECLTVYTEGSKKIGYLYKYSPMVCDASQFLSAISDKYYFVDRTEDLIAHYPIGVPAKIDQDLTISFTQDRVYLFSSKGYFKENEIPSFKFDPDTRNFLSEESNIQCVYQWPVEIYTKKRLPTDSIVVSLSSPKVQEVMKILEDMVSESFPKYDKTLFTKIGFGVSSEGGSGRRDGICFASYMSVGSSYCNYCNSFVIESSKDEEGNYDYSSNLQYFFKMGMKKEAIDNLIDLLQGEFVKSQDSDNKHYTLTSKKDPTIYFTWYINREY